MCIQNCEEFSIHQRAVLPFRGTSTAWRNRQSSGTLWSSAKRFAKPYIWGQITSSTGHAGCQMGWKAALLCGWTSWPWASCVPLQQRGSTDSWAVLGSTWPADQGRWFFTSPWDWWDHIKSRSGLPRYRKEVDVLEQVRQKAVRMIKGFENLSWTEDERAVVSQKLKSKLLSNVSVPFLWTTIYCLILWTWLLSCMQFLRPDHISVRISCIGILLLNFKCCMSLNNPL